MTKKQSNSPKEEGREILSQMRKETSSHEHSHNKEDAKKRDYERTRELAFTGDEDGFVALTKEREPNITASELLRRIRLFRELKRLRSTGA